MYSPDKRMSSPLKAGQAEPVVVIVDPYSSGKYLVQELMEQHWKMVAVQSSMDMASFWLEQLEPKYFEEVIVHESMEQTLKALEKFEVKAVTPGRKRNWQKLHEWLGRSATASLTSVFLAEDLQEALGMTECNGASTKIWRRHKFNMQERLRECGIRAVRQIYAKTAEEACVWQKEGNFGQWPIIVKPAMSGGTDGVYWCHSPEDVERAFAAECGKVNVNGELNDCLLAQEFLKGLEYIVDCVSFDGKHVLCGMWEYKKIYNDKDKSITYEYARMIESTGEKQDKLFEYMKKCLDAVDIKYGSSHGEVIMCHDGPCLVEVGARMHGLKGPIMTQQATGIGIHELVADVLVSGGRLHASLYESNYRYAIKKFAVEGMFNNLWQEGYLQKPIDHDGRVLGLKTVTAVFPGVQAGDNFKITRDLATAPGAFMMLHPNKRLIESDMAKIRAWEATDFYTVGATPPESDKEGLEELKKQGSFAGSLPGGENMMVSPFCMSPKQEACGEEEDALGSPGRPSGSLCKGGLAQEFDAAMHELELDGLEDSQEEKEEVLNLPHKLISTESLPDNAAIGA